MIWVFVLAIGIAMTFMTLGAFSVWLKVLVIGLKVLLFVVSVLTLTFIWQRFCRKSLAVHDGGG